MSLIDIPVGSVIMIGMDKTICASRFDRTDVYFAEFFNSED